MFKRLIAFANKPLPQWYCESVSSEFKDTGCKICWKCVLVLTIIVIAALFVSKYTQ